jgi:iron(II)-dependent oxidoreductase
MALAQRRKSWFARLLDWRKDLSQRRQKRGESAVATVKERIHRSTSAASDTGGLVDQMLAQGRFALLLRPQLSGNLTPDQLDQARELLMENMTLVPVGEVVLGQIDELLDEGQLDDDALLTAAASIVPVEPYFIDRTTVTNDQYFEFVAAGGYAELAIWDREIWPAMIDFVDATGQPGPRYWHHGKYPAGEENFPVVGICWYEAAAFARWIGKRLPTDAEWVKAGAWPVQLTPTTRIQRRYPWGNSMQATRANLWASGPGHAVGVDDFAEGDSVGGVRQLIGNVWEWTAGWLGEEVDDERRLVLPIPMRSIRGGAFDTYFEHQATCQFQSGENPVLRKHNIGFRCAVSVCDFGGLDDSEVEEMPGEDDAVGDSTASSEPPDRQSEQPQLQEAHV